MVSDTVAKSTTIALGIVLALVGVSDIWLSMRYSSDSSISATVQALSNKHPALPFAVGMLMGHLFWR